MNDVFICIDAQGIVLGCFTSYEMARRSWNLTFMAKVVGFHGMSNYCSVIVDRAVVGKIVRQAVLTRADHL